MPNFEKSFSDYLDSKDYDNASEALFAITRTAFKAGWVAAGNDLSGPSSDEAVQGVEYGNKLIKPGKFTLD